MTDPSTKLEDLLQLGRKSFSPDSERLEAVHAALGAKVAALPTATAAARGLGHALRSALGGTPTRWIVSCVFVGAAATGAVALTVPRAAPHERGSPAAVVASTPTTAAHVAVTPGSATDWVPAAPFPPLVSTQGAPPEAPNPGVPGAGRPHHVRPAFPGAAPPAVDRAAPSNDVARPIDPSTPGDLDTTGTAAPMSGATGTASTTGTATTSASVDPIAAVPRPAPSVAVSPAQDNLAGEVAALSAARLALHQGDAGRSLSILDAYAALHPRGTLEEERLATRILALCALGRSSAARAAAQSLERLAPSSPQWVTIDASCAGRGTPHDR
jgi:hypothetical protein